MNDHFVLEDLVVSGAELQKHDFILRDDVEPISLPPLYIFWSKKIQPGNVRLPVYTNAARKSILFFLPLQHAKSSEFKKRNIAIF
jgi:hypothetical protein